MDLQQQLLKTNVTNNSILTVGVFDGVHLGHLHLIDRLKKIANQENCQSGILTFTNHPAEILNPDFKPSFIMGAEQKISALKKTNVDFVIPIIFNKTISNMTALEFIDCLQNNLNMKGLVAGPDFAMGKNRQTTILELETLGKQEGFITEIVGSQEIDGIPLRSTTIRKYLSSGEVKGASKVLGRNFRIRGSVIHGEKRGRQLGYPTANIKTPINSILPQNGIYATFTYIKGEKFISATSIGTNPTFGGNNKTIETHIFNFNENIYDLTIEVEFISRLRDEIKFTSTEDLITQMDADILEIKRVLKP